MRAILPPVRGVYHAGSQARRTCTERGKVGFDSLRNKTEAFVDENEEKIDKGIDKAAEAAGRKLGHDDRLDKSAGKLKGLTGDNKTDARTDNAE